MTEPLDSSSVPITLTPITLTPIAHIRSCYPERFGIPRQPGLVPSAQAVIVFTMTEENKLALRGIEEFSHLWVLFIFHKQAFGRFKPLVRPPRLGGNKSMGVYATRSPNRPNPIGMSVVRLTQVERCKDEILLHVGGGDFLDGTPVIDIKPYIGYADAIATPESTWATDQEPPLTVAWQPAATAALLASPCPHPEKIRQLIDETLSQDPRPGYERCKDGRTDQKWNMRVAGFSIYWKVEAGIAIVTKLEPIE